VAHPSRPFVTVVSGAPRSGTSMMMRMLEVGGMPILTDGERGADRDNPGGYYEFEPVKRTREDGSWVDSAGGLVVKMVYMLLADLPAGPEYRVVLMRRDLDEMVASQKRMLERLGRPAGALSDAKRIAMFATHLERIERELPSRPGFSLLVVDYNQLLADARPQLEQIDGFLGGGLDVEAMTAVVDPTLYRNRGD
jgi:hypothetical protein